jgi:hypothetical protein
MEMAVADRFRREALHVKGDKSSARMGISLATVGTAFRFIAQTGHAAVAAGPRSAGIVTVLAPIAFIIRFAFSLGPVTWTVINEVFPAHICSRGVAFATAVNWGSAFLVSQGFLSLAGWVGSSWTFWLFGLLCGIGWARIYYRVPKTKGQALQQIQEMWKEKP